MAKSHKLKDNNLELKDNNLTIKDNNLTDKRIGRPAINLEEYESAIFELLSYGATISQVAEYVGITPETYYNYCKSHKSFFNKMNIARNSIGINAKKNIAKDIEQGDIETSKWHLEHTEYRPKEAVAFEDKNIKFVISRQ